MLKFADSYHGFEKELRNLLSAGDIETATRNAHSLKGVAGNLGATELFKWAGDLEIVLKDNRVGSLDDNISKVSTTLSEVLESISKFENRTSNLTPSIVVKSVDFSKLKKLTESLIILIEEDMSDAMDKLDELGELLMSTELEGEYQKIADYLDNFDVDAAKEKLEKLISKFKKT